ncbi:MAG: TrkH family potassium uptake protein [Clostridia bacterium]|nr:TrkH family potassium uptake protein [Clostridia bacterium]
MNYKMMGRVCSMILVITATFMIPSVILELVDGERRAALSFLITMAVMYAVAIVLALLSLRAKRDFYAREGLITVSLSWLLMGALGCLPLCLSGQVPRYIDAFFEIVSGFTTTGASVVAMPEALSRGILLWRSFTHWLGGMGVLVFLLALVPLNGKNEGFTMHLLRAESPGPDVGKLVPKMRQTATVLYATYLGLSVLNLIFLLAGGMPTFDAFCTMFGTAGTGGFGVRSDSLASYSPYIQTVTTVFLILFGINFSCYYLLLLRNVRAVLRDEELRMYLCIVAASIGLVAWNIRDLYDTVGETLRHAAFQVVSILTTAGFATTDFDLWPSLSCVILLTLMFVGACAGSTGGGFKVSRLLLLIKGVRRNIKQMVQPQKIQVIRVNKKPVSERIMANTNAYLAIYVLIVIASTLIVSLDSFSPITHFSAVLACFNNIGPGLGAVGPTQNYSGYSDLSKLVLIFDMLAGRLEIIPVLVLFSPKSWKRSK